MNLAKSCFAVLLLAATPVAFADVFDDLRDACIQPEEVRDNICDAIEGDVGNLACELAKNTVNTAETACLDTVDSAETTVTFLQEQNFVVTGVGTGSACVAGSNNTQCLNVAITSLFSPIAGRSVSVCAAAAPGAMLVTMDCDGLFAVPASGASVGMQPLGTALGTANATARFPDIKNLGETFEISAGATANPTLSLP